MGRKTKLISTHCKRCGKPIYTLRKHIYSSKEIQMEFSRICKDCMTPEEKERMNQAFKSCILS